MLRRPGEREKNGSARGMPGREKREKRPARALSLFPSFPARPPKPNIIEKNDYHREPLGRKEYSSDQLFLEFAEF